MHRRKRILKKLYYPVTKQYNIAFIIPTTSNKRNYKECKDMDFFNILYDSFLKTAKRENYSYSFYLGYDDDDIFYTNNLEKIKAHFTSFRNDDKLFLIPMKNLKGKVGQIWTKLAFEAAEKNDFLYQIGDDINLLTSGWEDIFISYLKSVNYIGAVGPCDINNISLITQSFVHIKHLKIFNYYFPPEIDNWYVDNWINDIYPAKLMTYIKVKNSGGPPRYVINNNKENFLKILDRDKEKLLKILDKDSKNNQKMSHMKGLKDKGRKKLTISEERDDLLLTIMIPTIISRKDKFYTITEKLMKQIKENDLENLIEIIAHFDNKTVGLSLKRTNMLRTSGGKFVISLDDDDDVADDYIISIIGAIKNNPEADVITFKQHCNCDGSEFYVESDINNSLSGSKIQGVLHRYPWIWCAWRKEKVDIFVYEDIGKVNYREDEFWLKHVRESGRIKKEVKIDKILHYYRFSSKNTETQKF